VAKIDDAVAELTMFHGGHSNHARAGTLVSVANDKKLDEAKIKSNDTSPEEAQIGDLFLNFNEGGVLAADALTVFDNFESGEETKLGDMITVSYEPGVGSQNGSARRKYYSDNNIRKGAQEGAQVSVRGILGKESVVNMRPSNPTKLNPALSVIQIYPTNLSLSTRETGAAEIFINGIPNIEMSKCVPYIDIKLITPRAPIDSEGRIEKISLSRFLIGQKKLSAGSTDFEMAGSFDPELSTVPDTSVTNIDIFTAPQTLVNADDIYDAKSRSAKVIDKFRPFVSIKSLKFSATGMGGMMSYKTGNLTLVLHDRSRLSEIAEFVKPELYSTTELLIEYGWSHPDGSALSNNSYGKFLDSLKCKEKYGIKNSSFQFRDGGQVDVSIELFMKGAVDLDTTTTGMGSKVESAVKQINEITAAISAIRRKTLGEGKHFKDVVGTSIIDVASDTSRAVALDKDDAAAVRAFIRKNKRSTGSQGELRKQLVALYGSNGRGTKGKLADLKSTIKHTNERKSDLLKATPDPFLHNENFKSIDTTKKGIDNYVSLGKLLLAYVGEPLASTGKFDEVQLVFYSFNSRASFMHDHNIAEMPIRLSDFFDAIEKESRVRADIPIKDFIRMMNRAFVNNTSAEAYGLREIYRRRTDKDGQVIAPDLTRVNDQKAATLRTAYGDNSEVMFKLPYIHMMIEALPAKEVVNGKLISNDSGSEKTLLRLHVFDKQCTSYAGVDAMLRAARDSHIGTLGKVASQIRRAHKKNEEPKSDHLKQFSAQLQKAMSLNIVEARPETVGKTLLGNGEVLKLDTVSIDGFKIKGGFESLKRFVKETMPTITYGVQNTNIITAGLASNHDTGIGTVNMLRAGVKGATAAQARDAGVPLLVAPTILQVELLGCPIINFGQQFFVDFGTGTTVDNVYAVFGVEHSLEPGKFRTSLKMGLLDSFGRYETLLTNIGQALKVVGDTDEDDF
jgi:hypothetical protein